MINWYIFWIAAIGSGLVIVITLWLILEFAHAK